MNHTSAAAFVRRYLDERLPEPRSPWAKAEFKQRTYSRWAADEILSRIIEEDLKLPYHISGIEKREPRRIVKDFIDELYSAWDDADNIDRKHMYSTAIYTAEEILHLLYY